jgi:hypothetical protein
VLSFEHHPIYDDDVRRRIPDVSKLRQTFEWEPRTKVRDSLEECIRHRFNTDAPATDRQA